MKSIRLLDRRAGYSLASIGLLLGIVAPAALPAFASADLLGSRSIEMSTAAADASSVQYKVSFTPSAAFKSVVLDFCTNTPVIGDTTCDAPVGFSVSTATAAFSTNTIGTVSYGTNTANHIDIEGTASAAVSAVVFTISGVHNPTDAGTFYARIYTYSGTTPTYVDYDTLGTTVDTGGVALSATDEVGVTAYVAESMLFCVAGSGDDGSVDAPDADCTNASTSPSLKLGSDVGDQKILGTTLATATDYAQISTNAAHGAVVNLKSNATGCGGLFRDNNTDNCDIAPQTSSGMGISNGDGLFGLTVGAATSASGAANPSGDLTPATGYDATHYFMDYVDGDTSGVTSTYGSPLFDTSNGTDPAGPVNNKYVELTFGAAAANTTAAGVYGATFNLIATGTF